MRKAEITIMPLTTVHPGSRRPRVPPHTHTHTYIHAHYCSRQFTSVHDAFPVSLHFSFSSLPFLSVCAHENLFRNCIKGTFAPGSLSGRFRSGRVQSGLVSALREISPFARVSAFSVVVRPSNFAFRFRPCDRRRGCAIFCVRTCRVGFESRSSSDLISQN